MKRKLEVSELIFKVISYVLLTFFAVCCLYPFIYTVSSAISGRQAVAYSEVVLFPKQVQFDAFKEMFGRNAFWNSYANTLFLTFYGTIWEVFLSILGAYALSKKRLLFRKGFNFFLVFTMWFSAGIVPQYLNYSNTWIIFKNIGIKDMRWMIIIAMGMAAMNIILLRNSFEGVPSEIEEAAIVDGATEMQVLWRVYIPMSKSIIATVSLFFAISRWNGYFWAMKMTAGADVRDAKPLMVYVREQLEEIQNPEYVDPGNTPYHPDSLIYALIICSVIPILVIYPFIQKYFAKGTNVGGVKE